MHQSVADIPCISVAKVLMSRSDMREILVRVIELMGFTAFTSKNGTGGVEKAVVEKPNLILMDIMMPEISGGRPRKCFAAILRPRMSRSSHRQRYSVQSDLQRCIDAGNDYIIKPFTERAA
jgi:CheY-like chemotaxis protein